MPKVASVAFEETVEKLVKARRTFLEKLAFFKLSNESNLCQSVFERNRALEEYNRLFTELTIKVRGDLEEL